jgi:hypothetical protein
MGRIIALLLMAAALGGCAHDLSPGTQFWLGWQSLWGPPPVYAAAPGAPASAYAAVPNAQAQANATAEDCERLKMSERPRQ